MKKNLLIVSTFLSSALCVNAQITITTADVAAPIKVIYQSNDTLPSAGLSVGSAGTSQTWNMSMLNSHTVDTMTFMSYAWVPDAAFPTSNLVMKQGWQNNYAYLTNSSTGLTVEGNAGAVDFGAGPVNVKQKNTPSEILMQFPATYLTSYTNNFRQVLPSTYFGVDPGIGITIDSIATKSSQNKTVVIDAWGSLTTPLGTYNVLRSKETIVKHDTTDIFALGAWNPFAGFTPQVSADSTTGYSWWANGVGFPLVSIKLDSLGAIKQVQWLLSLPLAGINEYASATQVNIYPNPAQNQIKIDVDANKVASVQVFDIAGRLVKSFSVTADNTVVNTSDLANGQYSFRVYGKDQTVLNQGKFAIVK